MRYSRSPQLSDPLQRPCRVSSPSLRNELAVRLSMRITGISVPLRPLVFSLGSSRSARSVRLLDRPLEVPRADCVPADHREHRLAQREVAVEERPNARVLDLVRVRSGVSLDFSSHYQLSGQDIVRRAEPRQSAHRARCGTIRRLETVEDVKTLVGSETETWQLTQSPWFA